MTGSVSSGRVIEKQKDISETAKKMNTKIIKELREMCLVTN
jgi:hypothetical protein